MGGICVTQLFHASTPSSRHGWIEVSYFMRWALHKVTATFSGSVTHNRGVSFDPESLRGHHHPSDERCAPGFSTACELH